MHGLLQSFLPALTRGNPAFRIEIEEMSLQPLSSNQSRTETAQSLLCDEWLMKIRDTRHFRSIRESIANLTYCY